MMMDKIDGQREESKKKKKIRGQEKTKTTRNSHHACVQLNEGEIHIAHAFAPFFLRFAFTA